MRSSRDTILVLNAGSSSVKFSGFAERASERAIHGAWSNEIEGARARTCKEEGYDKAEDAGRCDGDWHD